MNLIEAWTLWCSGDLSPDVLLWGLSIFWWGRLGKMMQFVGGATIVADIIGPEKIRGFGSSLHVAVTPGSLIRFLRDSLEWYQVVFRHTLMKDYSDEGHRRRDRTRLTRLDRLNYALCFLLTVMVMVSIRLPFMGWVLLVEAAIIYGCLLVSVSPLLTVCTIILAIMAGFTVNVLFFQPLAWVLERSSLDQLIKIVSLLFLLAGFHFELLAS